MAEQGNYYVPEQSKLPLLAALGMGTMGFGAATWVIDGQSATVFVVGLAILAIVMYKWWSIVIEENMKGMVSDQLKHSYVLGMLWFIFSEVMFFAAFFGALFYVRTLAVPWLAGEGSKGAYISAIELWPAFESSWPVMTTPDQGTEYDLADKSMAWPGWDHALKWLPLWNTIVLLSSSVTVHIAHLGLKKGNRKRFNTFLGITVFLALIFVGLQAAEYYEAYAHYGLTLNSGIYGSTFFMLTGFHGFHVMMGGFMLAIMLGRSVFAGHFEEHDHFGFEAASWYWHFVDVVWVMLFLFVYIL